MLGWFQENLGSIVLVLLLLLVVVLIVRRLILDKKAGKHSCGCSCGACGACGVCGSHSKDGQSCGE